MKFYLLRHEFNLMVNNKKNILLIGFIFLAMCSYIFIILPNQQTTESMDSKEMAQELEILTNVQKTRESRGATGMSLMGGRNFYADTHYYMKVHRALLHAYEQGNFERYAYLRAHYYESLNKGFIYSGDLIPDTPFPMKDRTHWYEKRLLTYKHLLSTDIPITYEVVEKKTALQVLQNFLFTLGPYILIFCAIYFSNDVLVRDRRQTSTLEGLPISWYQQINSKTIVAFFYTLLALFGLMVIGFVLLSIKNGFGSVQMKIPELGDRIDNIQYDYNMMPIMKYILMSLGFAPIFIFIFIRLNMMFSLLFRNEWIVLVLGTICLVSEQFYFARDKREIFGIDISYFPQTYFDFGKVVTGEKNYLINMETITYVQGMTVLFITFVAVEIALFIFTAIINKRRFYRS